MEDVNNFDYEGFRKKLNKHLGEIVFITYYDDIRKKTITEKAVISILNSHSLIFVTAYNDSLFTNCIKMHKIELIVSYYYNEVIYDVNNKVSGRKKK